MEQDIVFLKLLSTKILDIYTKDIKLLFRASEHEFEGLKFHELCDGHAPTITIIKSNFKNIFGGYTNIPWSSDGTFHRDKGASFLFLLHSEDASQDTQIWELWNDQKLNMVKKMDHVLEIDVISIKKQI